MSSTGIISKVIVPTTGMLEKQKAMETNFSAMPGPVEQTRRLLGTISSIHPDKPRLIKAIGRTGNMLANGEWIELNHSAQEITERWGTVRPGFQVRIHFSGMGDTVADATIISTEYKDITEPHQPNEAERGLYWIFTPGIY